MAAAIRAAGYTLVGDASEADVVVLNTCSFIQAATEESIAEAFALAGEWRPAREGRKLVVAGCMVSRYGDELAEAMPEADAFLGVADEPSLVRILTELLGTPPLPSAGEAEVRTPGSLTAYLKVSEGCDRGCTYCTIPAIRGPFVSADPNTLLAEAAFLIASGTRELVLVGQDIAAYGLDRGGGTDLAWLVRALDALEGEFRIRLMYVQPDGVTDALLEAIASGSHVCRYLDIPLQHASAGVLQRMGRTGDAQRFLTLLDRIRAAVPDITLRTTVIAGFPGETDAQASELETFLRDAEFDYVGVFPYSQEEGTPAAAMEDQVAEDVRLERAQRLRDVADEAGFARAEALIGTVQRVLVEGEEDGELVGRTCGQAPDVDGIVVIDGEVEERPFADVRITEAAGYDLIGTAL